MTLIEKQVAYQTLAPRKSMDSKSGGKTECCSVETDEAALNRAIIAGRVLFFRAQLRDLRAHESLDTHDKGLRSLT